MTTSEHVYDPEEAQPFGHADPAGEGGMSELWVAAWIDPEAGDENDAYALVGVFADREQARLACEIDWTVSGGEGALGDFGWTDDLHAVAEHYYYVITPAVVGQRIDPGGECGQCGGAPGSDPTCDTCVGSESQWAGG